MESKKFYKKFRFSRKGGFIIITMVLLTSFLLASQGSLSVLQPVSCPTTTPPLPQAADEPYVIFADDFDDDNLFYAPSGWVTNFNGDEQDGIFWVTKIGGVGSPCVEVATVWGDIEYGYADFETETSVCQLDFDVYMLSETVDMQYKMLLQSNEGSTTIATILFNTLGGYNEPFTVTVEGTTGETTFYNGWHHISVDFHGSKITLSVDSTPELVDIYYDGGAIQRLRLEGADEADVSILYDNFEVVQTDPDLLFLEDFEDDTVDEVPGGWTTNNNPGSYLFFITGAPGTSHPSQYLNVTDNNDGSNVYGYTDFASGLTVGIMEFDVYMPYVTGGSTVKDYYVKLQTSSGNVTLCTLVFSDTTSSNTFTITLNGVAVTSPFSEDTWHHVLLGFDGTSMDLFVDGVSKLADVACTAGTIQRFRIETTISTTGGGCHFDNILVTTGNTSPWSSECQDISYYDDESGQLCWVIYDEGAIAINAQWKVKRNGDVVASGAFTHDGQEVPISCDMKNPATYVYTLYVDDGYTGFLLLDTVQVFVYDDDTSGPTMGTPVQLPGWLWSSVLIGIIDPSGVQSLGRVKWTNGAWSNLVLYSGDIYAGVWAASTLGWATAKFIDCYDLDMDRAGDQGYSYWGSQ